MRYLSAAVTLCLFWLLLSGHYTGLLLSLGALAVALVVWFLWRMDKADATPIHVRPRLGLLSYTIWLIWAVVRSNIDVVQRIWSPTLPVRPTWKRLKVGLETPLQKTLYANSITLTPGTLTAEVEDDHFLVHGLSEESFADLANGEMERRVRQSGI